MTSRFNDFDDDLHFKSQSSSKYDDFEEQNNELGYKSDPKSNSNGTRFTSDSFSSTKPAINIKLKSDVGVPEENDFDPRAGELSTSSKTGGDFADFQSYFGAGEGDTSAATGGTGIPSSTSNATATTGATNTANMDFFNSTEPVPSSSSGGMDLLGLEISSPVLPAQQVIGSNSSFDGFQQGFQSFQGFQNVQHPPQSLPFQPIPNFTTSPLQQNLPQQNLLFGNHDVPLISGSNVGMLQPQQVNHINNNNVQHGSSGGMKKQTLEVDIQFT